MPLSHRTSRILDKGQLRVLKLKAIDPNMDFGSDGNLRTLTQQIERLQTTLNDYNTELAKIDAMKLQIDDMEKQLGDLLDQMLSSVRVKYGNDSREYEMAGGTRKSDRIRRSSEGRAKNNVRKLIKTPVSSK
ncbi:MAG: hypothetical protein KME13_15845 [Myxacorys californica WJT36-NPBG1]|jgi:hypothetical protein|nr:hypothetical protein [Myxacorys californica WJT36-NPBG1]